ncbi:MAG: sulfatase-like hydrolase/transferase [Steroidobacteraceae bacterium]|nr:sulfatase-like hydrolase/transferase [Steroidobacteraceae bacterium]
MSFGVVCLFVGLVTRVVLWMKFGPAADVPGAHLPMLLLAGLLNDAVESLYLTTPLALYLFLLPDRWYHSRFNRVLLSTGFVVAISGLVFLALAEYFFFEEFDARFNLVAFDYLVYPAEVFVDIWEAYPVVPGLIGSLAVAGAACWMFRRWLLPREASAAALRLRVAPFAMHAALLMAAILWYPTDALSWSSNRVENELLQNGYSSFFRAAATNEIDYHAYYASRDPASNLKLLANALEAGGGRFTRLDEGRLDRRFPARPDGLGRMNVVVVSSESFGAKFSRLYGSKNDLTPNFDSYAQRGIWFAHTYASGTRTVRGLEALTASFPPIPTVSIVRRPGNQGIATWGRVMRGLGYDTSFLYGGYGYFDNMNAFYAGNGYEVLDRDAIDHARFENIWGVADEDLFDLALDHFSDLHAQGKPFFSIVMTTSNHKPYTFRAGLEDLGIPESGGGRKAGVRYADYALGYFLQQAEQQPWFDDTIFVVIADHGARVYGKADIPLNSYEIPLMIYAPKHLEPRRVDTLMSQIDVAPTVLGLLGLPYEAPFFGQDVLHSPESSRVALFSHDHDVAIYRAGRLAVLDMDGKVRDFLYDRDHEDFAPAAPDPSLDALGIAYFQTASELFQAHRYE